MRKFFTGGFNLLVLTIAAILVLPHCAKYKPTELPHPAGQHQESNGVSVIARKLTSSECANCFDSKSLAKKFDALQVYVQNKSDESVVLSSTNISLPIASKKDISYKIYRNTIGRAGTYGFIGLFAPLFFIPAAVDGAKSSSANHKIDIDVKNKVLLQNEKEVIAPHNSINKVVFVSKNCANKNFDITLTNEKLAPVAKFTYDV
jgi:hypothetical protein